MLPTAELNGESLLLNLRIEEFSADNLKYGKDIIELAELHGFFQDSVRQSINALKKKLYESNRVRRGLHSPEFGNYCHVFIDDLKGEKLAGFIIFNLTDKMPPQKAKYFSENVPKDTPYIYVSFLFFDTDYRQFGLGKWIVDLFKAMQLSKDKGVLVEAEVSTKNYTEALLFWEKQGLRVHREDSIIGHTKSLYGHFKDWDFEI